MSDDIHCTCIAHTTHTDTYSICTLHARIIYGARALRDGIDPLALLCLRPPLTATGRDPQVEPSACCLCAGTRAEARPFPRRTGDARSAPHRGRTHRHKDAGPNPRGCHTRSGRPSKDSGGPPPRPAPVRSGPNPGGKQWGRRGRGDPLCSGVAWRLSQSNRGRPAQAAVVPPVEPPLSRTGPAERSLRECRRPPQGQGLQRGPWGVPTHVQSRRVVVASGQQLLRRHRIHTILYWHTPYNTATCHCTAQPSTPHSTQSALTRRMHSMMIR